MEYIARWKSNGVTNSSEVLETDSEDFAVKYFQDTFGSKLVEVLRVEGELEDDIRTTIWEA